MTFKSWLGQKDDIFDLLKYIDPDVLHQDFNATTFIYLEKYDKLLTADGHTTHASLIDEYDLHWTNKGLNGPEFPDITRASFGRIDIINNIHHANDYLRDIAIEYPNTGAVALWEHSAGLRLDNNLLNKTINKLLELKFITKDFYVVPEFKPPYQISGESGRGLEGKDKELHKMAGELHFLPYGDPRRREIVNVAMELKSKPDSGRYKWFIDRVLPDKKQLTKHPFQAEMEKQKLIHPGQKWWGTTSESINERVYLTLHPRFGSSFKIYLNPTSDELRTLPGNLRGLIDEDGDLFVWESKQAIHHYVANQLDIKIYYPILINYTQSLNGYKVLAYAHRDDLGNIKDNINIKNMFQHVNYTIEQGR